MLQGNADLQGYGNGQANALYGNVGNNLLDGSAGADALVGGAGNDTYFVDDANDAMFENANEGIDVVLATAHFGLSANLEILVLQGGADLQGYGNGLTNSLYGNAGNNLLNGGTDADAMVGGAGNDTYFVDNAGDTVFEYVNEGTDAVFATVSYILTSNVETLVLQGGSSLSGTGNAMNNSLYGNYGDNTLNGGAGADVLTGNTGKDIFMFNADPGKRRHRRGFRRSRRRRRAIPCTSSDSAPPRRVLHSSRSARPANGRSTPALTPTTRSSRSATLPRSTRATSCSLEMCAGSSGPRENIGLQPGRLSFPPDRARADEAQVGATKEIFQHGASARAELECREYAGWPDGRLP